MNMASSDCSQQREHPKRAELTDVNINTGVQSINTESFFKKQELWPLTLTLLRFSVQIKFEKCNNNKKRKKERKIDSLTHPELSFEWSDI